MHNDEDNKSASISNLQESSKLKNDAFESKYEESFEDQRKDSNVNREKLFQNKTNSKLLEKYIKGKAQRDSHNKSSYQPMGQARKIQDLASSVTLDKFLKKEWKRIKTSPQYNSDEDKIKAFEVVVFNYANVLYKNLGLNLELNSAKFINEVTIIEAFIDKHSLSQARIYELERELEKHSEQFDQARDASIQFIDAVDELRNNSRLMAQELLDNDKKYGDQKQITDIHSKNILKSMTFIIPAAALFVAALVTVPHVLAGIKATSLIIGAAAGTDIITLMASSLAGGLTALSTTCIATSAIAASIMAACLGRKGATIFFESIIKNRIGDEQINILNSHLNNFKNANDLLQKAVSMQVGVLNK